MKWDNGYTSVRVKTLNIHKFQLQANYTLYCWESTSMQKIFKHGRRAEKKKKLFIFSLKKKARDTPHHKSNCSTKKLLWYGRFNKFITAFRLLQIHVKEQIRGTMSYRIVALSTLELVLNFEGKPTNLRSIGAWCIGDIVVILSNLCV